MTKSARVLVGGAGLLLLVLFSFYFLRKTPSPADVAFQVDRELVAGNAEELWKHIHPIDAANARITKEVFVRFYKEYFLPSLEGVKFVESTGRQGESGLGETDDTYWVTRKAKLPNGEELAMGIVAVPTNTGPVPADLTRAMILYAMGCRHKKPSDRSVWQWQIRALEADTPLLKEIGLEGITHGKGEFETFDQRLENLRRMQAKK